MFCFPEATYAYKCSKHLIFLLLEDGYAADGWLGLLKGMKLHYRFCSDDDFKTNTPKLIDAIRKGPVDDF